MIDLTKLQEIKRALPHGSIAEIAKKANVSELTVRRFFKGDSTNPAIMAAVTTVYNKHIEQITAFNSLLQA